MTKHYRVSLARNVTAAVVKNGVQSVFAQRLKRARKVARTIVIASPWISGEGDGKSAFDTITALIERYRIPTYVFTRTPQNHAHNSALLTLIRCPTVEIVLNDNLHAKVYACLAPHPYGFALLGSANLTDGSNSLYEIGLIVLATGGGEQTVKELAAFGLNYLRTRPDSIVQKRISLRGEYPR